VELDKYETAFMRRSRISEFNLCEITNW